MKQNIQNIPNIITSVRIFMIPIIAVLLYIDTKSTDIIAFSLYFVACVSDYFDGMLARKMSVITDLGKFLDPIADKLLVSIVILMLVAINRIDGLDLIPAIIILAREFAVSGLREFIASTNKKIEKDKLGVSYLAKIKTTIQMFSLGFLTFNQGLSYVPSIQVGLILLWIAALLTIFTGYEYMKIGLNLLCEHDKNDNNNK